MLVGGMAAFVAVPFAITGLYRAWDAVPTALPHLIVLAAVAVAWRVRSAARPIAVGALLGAAAHAVALTWLLASVSTDV